MPQMLGLVVNNYIDFNDLEEYEAQRCATNAKMNAIFQMMQTLIQASAAPPLLAYPSTYTPLGQFPAKPSHHQAPHPTHVALPPLELQAIAAAIREDEDLRTRARESSGHAVLTPPPSRVGLHSEADTTAFTVVPIVVDRHGNATAQHTDMVIVEDTQGSPNDVAGQHRMDVEEQAARDRPASAWIDDVHMDTLDMGGKDDNYDCIQQTQSSPPEHLAEAMETESLAQVEVTNARLLINKEGPAAPSSAAAPLIDDEVIHLCDCY